MMTSSPFPLFSHPITSASVTATSSNRLLRGRTWFCAIPTAFLLVTLSNGKKTHRMVSASSSLFSNQARDSSRPPNLYLEVLKTARDKFTQEISFQSEDKDALLYVAAEDEAFMAINRDINARSLLNERKDASVSVDAEEWDCLEAMPLAKKSISEWLDELDAIAKEVEAELVSRDIGCHLVEVLEAVNVVLFDLRGFKRSRVLVDAEFSYMHTVLSSGCGSAILLSIIYIEVCRRLGLTIVGSRVGEDFLIWPQTGNPEELFKVSSGHSMFAIVNGRCVEDPRSKASDLNGNSLLGLDIATNRDVIGIALANLIVSSYKYEYVIRANILRLLPVGMNDKPSKIDGSKVPLLRPQDLRLAIMASERLLILQPHNWALRRDHGMLLYYSRMYGEAVQELSICMAFAPVEEAEILEPFVEKLHLLRLESSWKSLGHTDRLAVP
ncbi:hypothetical protein HHK36_028362 [Tetracentron sinense]|uniref:Protein SirB1 N-terminal domain-containing protein n=1 Tax=Tetracentron sinense TaxID=13715 RepID=A0A835D059_TETSI|nr:hypothetical protein HHK36_028362 [Tetracentron sinense]